MRTPYVLSRFLTALNGLAPAASNQIIHLVNACPSLHAPFRVTWWCSNAYAQFLLFLAKCALYARTYTRLFEPEVLELPDGQVVRLLWIHHAEPRGVVLLLHGILGVSTDFSPLARTLHAAGFAVVGFDRRGHGLPLTVPRFPKCRWCKRWCGISVIRRTGER